MEHEPRERQHHQPRTKHQPGGTSATTAAVPSSTPARPPQQQKPPSSSGGAGGGGGDGGGGGAGKPNRGRARGKRGGGGGGKGGQSEGGTPGTKGGGAPSVATATPGTSSDGGPAPSTPASTPSGRQGRGGGQGRAAPSEKGGGGGEGKGGSGKPRPNRRANQSAKATDSKNDRRAPPNVSGNVIATPPTDTAQAPTPGEQHANNGGSGRRNRGSRGGRRGGGADRRQPALDETTPDPATVQGSPKPNGANNETTELQQGSTAHVPPVEDAPEISRDTPSQADPARAAEPVEPVALSAGVTPLSTATDEALGTPVPPDTIASATTPPLQLTNTPGILILPRSTSAVANGSAAKSKPKRSRRGKKTRSPKPDGADPEDDDEADGESVTGKESGTKTAEPELTVAEALEKLPAQQVSITADTQVKILRRSNDSSHSLEHNRSPNGAPPKGAQDKRKKKVKKSDAQRHFNHEVRLCVERSQPDELRALLRDKHNHSYWLEDSVLEVVLTAYVVAAMFDDALYCLRNCTRPAVLSVHQAEHILSCLPQNLRNSSAFTAADMISQLCVATEFNPATHRSYFLRIVRGISLEFLEEATSARDRICTAPCERLVRAGLCVVDARLQRGKKASELVVLPGDQLGCFVPEGDQRGIAAGDAVSLLPYAGPYPMSAESLDRNMIEATVTNTNPMILRLQDKTNASLLAMLIDPAEGNVYRVDKLANRMGFNRQLAAAVAICTPAADNGARDYRRPCPELVKAITAMDENIVSLMRQSKNGVHPKGQLTSTAELCAEAIPWSVEDEGESFDPEASRAAARMALEKYGVLEGLNASQQLAVEGATTNRLTLVQGPPGTGKTAVAIRILQHWARLAAASASKNNLPAPILATSDSNIAVDNLVEGCAAVGLRVVRLGRPEAIRPELLKYCIDKPPAAYSASDRINYPNPNAQGQFHKERIKQLKSAQVICCTCIGSGGDMLDSLGPLEHVLVDEATQATEPALLVPLMRGCRQLVLVGDHCQLPPTVLSTRAEEEGHGVPLFSRMVACGVPPVMLDTQYRMHPCIAMFPSDLFYGGRLNNGVSSAERRPLAGFPWPREEFPVAFVPVKGEELDDGVSKYNEAEAAAACDAVAALLQGGQCGISDIAVVTPYAAQARLIRRMLRRLLPDNGPPYVEVSSVDGFQGREKEAVVFSAVRSNDYGAIGFTSDWRRVNVSFTRARRALIVIANDQTLRRGDPDTWSPWLAWVDAHGLNMDKPGIPRGRYDPEQLRRVRGGTTAAEMLKDVLERQQAQLKTAEQQQARATRNVRGQMFEESNGGRFGDTFATAEPEATAVRTMTLEEDLALMENVDGNWDDTDDEADAELHHSASKVTLTSACSSNDILSADDSNGAVDIWDL